MCHPHRQPNIYVAKQYAHSTGTQIEYSQHKGLEDNACEKLLLQALKDHGILTRGEIDRLLWNVVSDQLDDNHKTTKIKNLLIKFKRKGLIINHRDGSTSKWSLTNND